MAADHDCRTRFRCHGVRFTKHNDTQYIATCPFCSREEKFYVNRKRDCGTARSAASRDTSDRFCFGSAKGYERSLTSELLHHLAANRRLPEAAFTGWHIGWNGRHYTIPVFNSASTEVVGIRLFNPTTGGLWGTPGHGEIFKAVMLLYLRRLPSGRNATANRPAAENR